MRHVLAPARALLLLVWAGAARAGEVALTFDDLPYAGFSPSTEDAQQATRLLLAGLRRHHLPATGFVNEIQLDKSDRGKRIALLSEWLDAGMDLGNHIYSHRSLTNTPLPDFIADVAKGGQVTGTLLATRGRQERWFRHPYLETGPTLDVRDRFEVWLAQHGCRIAPVTMENADWQFAPAYEQALLTGDRKAAARIRSSDLDFTGRMVDWYQTAAQQLLGRQPAFVFLMHASRLNADNIDALAAILRAHHLTGVTLDRALMDPAYAVPDRYAGPDGDGWLDRWSLTLKKPLPWSSLPKVPDDIVQGSARASAARKAPRTQNPGQ